jgi:hypothetical protein
MDACVMPPIPGAIEVITRIRFYTEEPALDKGLGINIDEIPCTSSTMSKMARKDGNFCL